MKGILGRKVGMTEKFTKDGKIIPVTVVAVEPNVIMQVKTVNNDGYNAIQLGFTNKKEKSATKAEIGHAKKANVSPKRFLKEIKVSNPENYELGSTIKADIFEVGEKVDVQGTSKGKGFAGVIKRHNQSRGPETHGSRYHRRPGSRGPMRPMRVLKGKKLAGHMGFETRTVQNLTIIDVDLELNYILVSGNVPGAKNSLVLIKEAIKGGEKETFELISYELEVEETVCTCTDACATGYNPDCTCESEECHCKEPKEVATEEGQEETQIEEVIEETSDAEVTEEVTENAEEVIEEATSEEESK